MLEASRSHDTPPLLRIRTGQPTEAAGTWRVPVEVVNEGEVTAEGALIKVALDSNGQTLERAQLLIAFIPRKSRRAGWVTFRRDAVLRGGGTGDGVRAAVSVDWDGDTRSPHGHPLPQRSGVPRAAALNDGGNAVPCDARVSGRRCLRDRKRDAAAYHGQLETSVDESGTFDITLSSATAKLLRRDPQVARLEAPVVASGAATPWMSGTYEYDPAGNIRRIGTSLYVYAS